MLVLALLAAAAVAPRAAAYSWDFDTLPAQCGTVTLTVSGGGTPPFRALVNPYGHLDTYRPTLDLPFNTSTSLSFQLALPASSQFIVTVRAPFIQSSSSG
jgi:hypothetical protein